MKWLVWWTRWEKWILSLWSSVRLLSTFPIRSSQRSWYSMGWMNKQWGGLKTELPGPVSGDGTKSSWRPITTHITPGSILGPILINIFINVLDDGPEYNHSKLGRTGWFTQGSYWGLQRDLDRLEKWGDNNLIQSSKGKCNLWRNNPTHKYMLGGKSAGKQLCRIRPGDSGGQQVEHELEICPYIKDD